MSTSIHECLSIVAAGETLTQEQAEDVMHIMMRGEATPEQTAGLLMGLRARGEHIDELVGFTRVMRSYAVPITLEDPDAIDLCGTGGDGAGTFNVSTAAAFVCAGAGVTVAKHGNRAVSSKSGSADVLQALGVRVDLHRDGVEECLAEAGIAFIFAPFFHPALANVMPVRRQLGVRTFFNILGPLCNPAGVKRQLIGAFSRPVAESIATILGRLEAEHVVAVHSEDGLDEISVSAPTHAFEYRAGHAVARRLLRNETNGVGRYTNGALAGGNPKDNAHMLREVLAGTPGAHRDVVLLNAAWALVTSGKYRDVAQGMEAARLSIDSGAARQRLERLITVSNRARGEA